jgi:hypothetical protein
MRRIPKPVAVPALVAAVLAVGIPAFAADDAQTGARCSGGPGPTVSFTRRLPGKPGPMLLRKRTLWISIRGARPGRPGRLLRLDAVSGRVQRTFRLPIDPYRLVEGFGSLWITGETNKRTYSGVVRLDPRSGRVVDVIRGARTLGTALATTAHAVWVGGPDIYPKGRPEQAGVYFVYKIDPRRNAVVRGFRLRSTVINLAGDGAFLWVTGWYAVVKLSEAGRSLLRLPIDGSGWSIAPARDGAWVAHTFHGTRRDRPPPPARRLLRVRENAQPRLTVLELDASPWEVSAAAGVVWVALGEYSHEVQRIRDTRTPADPTKVPIRGVVHGVEAARNGAWVSQVTPNQLSRIC